MNIYRKSFDKARKFMNEYEIKNAMKHIKFNACDEERIKSLKDEEYFILKFQRWVFSKRIKYIEMHVMYSDRKIGVWQEPWDDFKKTYLEENDISSHSLLHGVNLSIGMSHQEWFEHKYNSLIVHSITKVVEEETKDSIVIDLRKYSGEIHQENTPEQLSDSVNNYSISDVSSEYSSNLMDCNEKRDQEKKYKEFQECLQLLKIPILLQNVILYKFQNLMR